MEVIKTGLSPKGYVIYKKQYSENEIEKIKKELTITPFVVPGYGNEDGNEPYKLFTENEEKMYVPYHYGVNKYGSPQKSKVAEPERINIKFASDRQMRPYQQDIIKTFHHHAQNTGGGIISVGCGRGKTVMALKIIEELGYKTLILVHKEFLANQWVERIKEYLPDAKIGYIQGKTLDIRDKDIVIGMIQSVSDPRKDKDYPLGIFEGFGLVVADECHHLAAKQFCRSLGKYAFKHSLGLSATPDRADGLARVFMHYLGNIIYKDSEIQKSEEDLRLEHIPDAEVMIYHYRFNHLSYNKELLNYQKKPNITGMKTAISKCVKRTKFVLSFIPKLIEEGRNILILSCRRDHIFQMEKMINDMAIPECSVGLYLGGMKQEDLDISAGKRVIIATYEMAEEAFDCKRLNVLIYGTPHKNIKQAVGRILREEKKKRVKVPLIIDVEDMFSSFNKWNKIREKYYKSYKYPMKFFEADDNVAPTEIKELKDKHFTPRIKKCNDTSINQEDDEYNNDDIDDEDDDEDIEDNELNNNKGKKGKKTVEIEFDF